MTVGEMKYSKDREERLRRGDVYYADLSPVVGSEQGGQRPVLIIQNDIGNRHSPTVIVAAITTRLTKPELPTHVQIQKCGSLKLRHSIVLLEQLRTIDKQRLNLRRCLARLTQSNMKQVDHALRVSLHL